MSDQVSAQALMSALTMPLTELRERVDLVERLAIASRHAVLTGSGSPTASATTTAGAGNKTQPPAADKGSAAAGGTKTQAAAPKPAATAPKPAAAAPAADDAVDLDAAFGDAGGGGDAGDFSAELGDGGDMLADFVPDMTPEDAKAASVKIAGAVIGKKDAAELTAARTVMQKFGVTKVSDVPNDRAVELLTEFKKAFPQYATA